MSWERAGRLAWAVPVVTVGCIAAFVALTPAQERDGTEWAFGLAFSAYAVVGALIVSRHPRNPVGWLFCLIGAPSAAHEALYAYASRPGRAPGEGAAAWLAAWTTEPSTAAIVLLLLLFPSGRFLSPRWRRVGWGAVAAAVVWAAALALDPGPLRSVKTIANPLGIDALDGILGPIVNLGPLVFLVLVGVGLAGVVVRFRRAPAQERRQIKWLALAAGYGAAVLLAMVGLILVVDTDEGFADVVTALLFASALASFPIAAGVAMLRHRLYDIDVVISRTLVYGTLTATLAGAYLAGVLLLQLVLQPSSDLAVAASTLAVAALFRPARARIQATVDRSFYRRRYDAARTLEAFGARLRDELDLEALGTDLRRVVGQTVQPAHVSLWLRRDVP